MSRVTDALLQLLNQFSDRPNTQLLLQGVLERMEDTSVLFEQLLLYRWLDTAEGIWLDYLGDIIGLPRPDGEKDDNLIFTLKAVGDSNNFTQALSSLSQLDGGVLTSLNGISNGVPISDDEYRTLLKAKILGTHSTPTIPNIYLFIKAIFDIESYVTAPSPGNVEVEILTALTAQERRILVTYAPIAAGDQITIVNWP